MRLSLTIVNRLCLALGFPTTEPLSWGAVEAYLNRWIAVRYHGTKVGGLGAAIGGGGTPGWMIWAATIAAKVARCPVDRWAKVHVGSSLPAVELVARAEFELRTVANELQQEASIVARGGGNREAYRQRVADYERTVEMVRHIRDGKAWRVGIDYLADELAMCERDDPSFGRICHDLGRRVEGE